MKKITPALVMVAILAATTITYAAEMEFKSSADLELFYELSNDVKGIDENDQLKSNQLYFQVDGVSEDGYEATLKLDGADIVSSDNKVVTEKIVEEANFTVKNVGGAPIDVCFGKDEQPFGMDYDKYLNDSITHLFEIDKVWGINATVKLDFMTIAAGTYEHRHSAPSANQTLLTADNNMGDNFTAKISSKKIAKILTVCISGANESYADVSTTDSVTGLTTTTAKDDETRLGAGFILECPKSIGNINAEYVSFQNMTGTKDYNPGLLTLGLEYKACEKFTLWGRYEIIEKDTTTDVETDFWSIGVMYSPITNYTFLVEYSNFNSSDFKDAYTDLIVAKGSMENSILLGVKAIY